MRIGHYAPRIVDEGGIATYIRRTGRAQSNRGHEIVYLGRNAGAASLPGKRVDVPTDEDVFAAAEDLALDILHLHRSVETLPADRVPTVRAIHDNQGGCPSGSRYLSRPGEPCDRAYSLSGCLWGHIVDRCGSMRPQNLARHFSRIERELDQARHIPTYTVSAFLRDKMVEAGCPRDELHIIRSPAPAVEDEVSSLPRTAPPRLLYLGRLVPQKGLPWLLRAFSEVSPPAALDVAGAGPQLEEMKTLCQRLGIRSQVTFHGWVNAQEVPSFMQQARAVVFPSVWHEPAGLISLEAAAHGRPLIASRVGGLPEYLHSDQALLVEPGNQEALADAITTLVQDGDRAEQMGRQGRAYVDAKFAMSDFLDTLHAFYHQALEARGRR